MTTKPTDQPTDADEATRKARGDAAGYRRRLRDAEAERDEITAERDRLLARVTARQRADVESLAGEAMVGGADLWSSVELADVLDDEGEIDKAKVETAVATLVAAKPHYARTPPTPQPDVSQGARTTTEPAAPTLHDVLRAGRR